MAPETCNKMCSNCCRDAVEFKFHPHATSVLYVFLAMYGPPLCFQLSSCFKQTKAIISQTAVTLIFTEPVSSNKNNYDWFLSRALLLQPDPPFSFSTRQLSIRAQALALWAQCLTHYGLDDYFGSEQRQRLLIRPSLWHIRVCYLLVPDVLCPEIKRRKS